MHPKMEARYKETQRRRQAKVESITSKVICAFISELERLINQLKQEHVSRDFNISSELICYYENLLHETRKLDSCSSDSLEKVAEFSATLKEANSQVNKRVSLGIAMRDAAESRSRGQVH